jgi:hypothetical protein
LHQDENRSVALFGKLSGKFPRKRELAFNGKRRQDFLFVADVPC